MLVVTIGPFACLSSEDMSLSSSFLSAGPAAEYFDKASALYERLTGGCTREVANFFLSLPLNVDSLLVVLDNACGTGIVTDEILTRFAVEGAPMPKIYAADVAPSMVSNLAAKAARKGWVNSNEGLLGLKSWSSQTTHLPTPIPTLVSSSSKRQRRWRRRSIELCSQEALPL